MTDINSCKDQMENQISYFKKELDDTRAGRVSPNMFDKIRVEYYGTQTPLNQVASINIIKAREVILQPWDSSLLQPIKKALINSDLNLNPVDDGKILRIIFAELSEEQRKKITKEINQKAEKYKIAIRNIRRDMIDNFRKSQKNNEITQDDLRDLEDQVQKITEKYISQITNLAELKNADIMKI